ncbi:GPW/gp25 family protein [Undibacterium sp. LX40W]|uniref:GPW/gp25 family protein n=1 Tax=Undibacterium nitidum TaxID=2762298 RepID=A0A923KQU3_9BURK|nr:GPW/gp25 family protein [Undibacterium nitidum]MBC3883338.1 GPW/gp25 family protein [Undibacterium nitidum]MBC3893620.1 GPW/gp25 family protein [Undibacterium sp. LX40W]
MDKDISFLGTGWSFPPEFSKRGTVQMVSAGEDIHQSLGIILATNLGERVMQPSFGCGIKSQVYENINESTMTVLKDLISRAILFYEPRVKLEAINMDTSSAYEGRLDFHIIYNIIATNTRHNIVYPYYLREGTDVQI